MNKVSRSAALAAAMLLTACGCSQLAGVVSSASKPPEVQSPLAFGRLYEQQGDVEQARQRFLAAAREPATRAEALHRLAVLEGRFGDRHQAERYFEQARRLNPNDAALWNDFGYHYLLAGRFVEAEAALRRALRLQPENARAMNNLAVTLGEQGRMHESLEVFLQVLSPGAAYANVGSLHAQRGDLSTAIELYEHALALDPTLTPAAEALADLDAHRRRDPSQQSSVIATVAASGPAPLGSAPPGAFARAEQAGWARVHAPVSDAPPTHHVPPLPHDAAAPALLPEPSAPSAPVGIATVGFDDALHVSHHGAHDVGSDAPQPRSPVLSSDGQDQVRQPDWPAEAPESTNESGWQLRR